MLHDTASASYTDDEIVSRVLNGESALFELLVRRTNPFIYRIGRSYGFNHEDTEDLMQEAHIDAFLSLSKFEHRAAYRSWLTRIMINRCLQRFRKLNYRNEVSTAEFNDLSIPAFQNGTTPTDPIASLMKSELKNLVEAALATLPVNYRTVFTLRELNQLSVQETAEALGITEVNVKVRLNRAKALLRKKLEAQFSSDDIYDFNLIHCDRLTNKVMARILPLG
jgi:RNA polymerase sigma factor (sigma-70 family)